MTHASLFSGIGGFDLAAQWMGWENVFQVEIDGFCQKVLEKNFPNVKRYGDIKQFNGTEWAGKIDVLSGGFPCQSFSVAGKRKGKEDNRYLWPEMLRVIGEIQPAYVVGENVYGLLNWSGGMVFEQVQVDLENLGYTVTPFVLPACSVGAPHRRDRVWFVAHADDNRFMHELGKARSQKREDKSKENQWQWVWSDLERIGNEGAFANANIKRVQRGAKSNNTYGEGEETKQLTWGYNQPPHWEKFPIESPIHNGNDGFPSWLVRSGTEAGGNAIVPQVAFEIFKAIEKVSI